MGSQKSMRSQRFMGSQRDTTEPMSTFPWVAMRRPGHAWSYRKRREPAGVHQSPGSLSHKVQEAERWMLSGWRSIKSSIPVVLHTSCFHSTASVLPRWCRGGSITNSSRQCQEKCCLTNPKSRACHVLLALEGLKMVEKDQDGSCKCTRPGQRSGQNCQTGGLPECRVASVVSDSL